MSAYSNPAGEPGRRRGLGWHPIELAAMVLGFMIFWPVGLAILFLKMWQRKTGHSGDMMDAAQAAFSQSSDWARDKARGFASPAQRWSGRPGWGQGPAPTGNSAFDDWRSGELARLEEERRRLMDAEREFAEHIDSLRRARDREEFDRFMQARSNKPAA